MAKEIRPEEKPWLNHYMFGPYELEESLEPYPKMPLYKILDDSAARYPIQAATEYFGQKIRYKDLKLQVDSLANALVRLGVKKGDRVATVFPPSPQYIISEFAILKTGAAVTPCSILRKASDLEWEIGESGAETIICQEESLELVKSVVPKTKLENIIVSSIKDYTPEEASTSKKITGVYQMRDLIATHEPKPPEVEIDPMEDLAYVVFTGGATGVPKGVMLTHYNRTTNIVQAIPWMMANYEPGIRGRSSFEVPLPLFHAYGQWAMQTAIYWGLRVILVQDPRDTETIVKLMIENRPFMISVVPTQLMRMYKYGIPRLPVTIMSGAAYLPSALREDISGKLMMPVSEGYGLTETSPITHMDLTGFSKITGFVSEQKYSIGLPVPDTDIKLIDMETDKECASGEDGHMYIRGPQVMKGYWPTPGSGLEDGWLPTGDIVRMDEDGYFYVVDRVKDMANISGYKVYTNTIDSALFKHSGVAMAVAIGIPDPERPGSERIKAFVRLKEGYESKVTTDELIQLCKGELPPYAVPKFVEFRDDLPLTVTEKLFKKQLQDEEIEKMKAEGVLK